MTCSAGFRKRSRFERKAQYDSVLPCNIPVLYTFNLSNRYGHMTDGTIFSMVFLQKKTTINKKQSSYLRPHPCRQGFDRGLHPVSDRAGKMESESRTFSIPRCRFASYQRGDSFVPLQYACRLRPACPGKQPAGLCPHQSLSVESDGQFPHVPCGVRQILRDAAFIVTESLQCGDCDDNSLFNDTMLMWKYSAFFAVVTAILFGLNDRRRS